MENPDGSIRFVSHVTAPTHRSPKLPSLSEKTKPIYNSRMKGDVHMAFESFDKERRGIR
ncbi:MAG: hypothetical protein ACLUKN_02500 [Bacilli bacterium]